MTVAPVSGPGIAVGTYLLSWTPSGDQCPAPGTLPYPVSTVTLVASDVQYPDMTDTIQFAVTVVPQPTGVPGPTVNPVPDRIVGAGNTLVQQVVASPITFGGSASFSPSQ